MSNLRTCSLCGWVHMGVTHEAVERAIAEFNTFYNNASAETRAMYSKPSSRSDYSSCFGCGAGHTVMRDFRAGDCPDGVTLQPILVD